MQLGAAGRTHHSNEQEKYMPYIEWNEEFSVKHAGIDSQHQEWIRILNVLHENLLSDDCKDLTKVTSDSLLAVKAYGEKHFKYEEGLLEKLGYPELEAHRHEHREFYRKIDEMYRNHVNGDIILNSQLMKMLQNWLTDHIMVEDMKLVGFLTETMEE